MSTRRGFGAAAAAVCWAVLHGVAGPAHAAEGARKFAALSVLGDSIQVVVYEGKTGSHLDRNQRDAMPVGDLLDRTALLAVDAGLKKADPARAVSLLLLPVQKTAAGREGLLDGTRFVPTEAVTAALKQAAATHLLLVSKHRAPASLQADSVSFGNGQLEGVGFYIDTALKVRSGKDESSSAGFLAPYAYIKVSLVDVASGQVLQQQTIRASAAYANDKGAGGDPWDALSSDRKAEVLRTLIRDEVVRVVPPMVEAL
jgi:hypothetical protein